MGYIKTYRNSKNKINPATVEFYPQTSLGSSTALSWVYSSSASGRVVRIPCSSNTQYILKPYGDALAGNFWRIGTVNSSAVPNPDSTVVAVNTIANSDTPPVKGTYFWTGNDIQYIVLQIPGSIYTDINDFKTMIGLYVVSSSTDPTPITCEPYNTKAWYDWIKRKTATAWTDGENKLYDGGWTPTNRQIAAEKAALTRKINSLKDAGEE